MAGNVAATESGRIGWGARSGRRLWVLLAVGALLLAVLFGGITWAQRAGWTMERPQVLGISPNDGMRNVPGNAPLAIQFSMPMNPDSALSNLSINPPTEGRFGWQGNTLVFTPTVGYQRGVTYTVQVGAGASSPLFQGLAAPVAVTFRTAGLPSVYRTVPLPDTSEVPTDTMVTIEFSQPMVPLAALDARGVSNSPDQVEIKPAPAGRWQWLGTTTLAFRAASLAPATQYNVTVSKNFTDIAGGQLDHDYSFSFSTIRPGVVAVSPENGSKYVGLRDPIVVHFNQPVDRASAEAGFSLAPSVTTKFDWSTDSTVMTATLAADLTRDTNYTATLATLKALPNSGAGDLTLAKPYGWIFHSSPLAKVSSTEPTNGAKGVALTSQLVAHFTAPISATQEQLLAGITIEPSVRGVQAYSYDDDTALNIYAQLAPSTEYKVSVGTGAGYTDRNGVAVPAYSWTFTTAALAPSATAINSNHMVSFYAGAPTRAYIDAVNVDFVRLRLWRISGDELIKFMGLTSDQQAQYQPTTPQLRMWDLQVEQVLNKRQALFPNLALDANADRLPPGFYYLRVTSPQTIDGTAVIVGNTALTLKTSDKEAVIWAVDMRDGKPIAGRNIQLFNTGETKSIPQGATDANGMVSFKADLRANYSLVVLTEGDDVGLVTPQWNQGIAPWNFNLNSFGQTGNLNAIIYTDRPIYRPGQTVHFKGVLRDDYDGRYSLPQQKSASIVVSDATGQQVYSATLGLSSFGSFTGDYTLPDYATLGSYYVSMTDNSAYYFGTSFNVQEYRKPEYLVSVSTDKQDYINGEKINATAGATYFFGGPVAGAQVRTRLQSQDYYFSWTDPDSGEYYDFQDSYAVAQYSAEGGATVRNESTTTSDADGLIKWTIPADLGTRQTSQLYTIEAAVQDTSNQEVANSAEVIVHAGQYYIGLRPDLYVGVAGQPVSVKAQLVGLDKQKYGPADLKLSYYKRVWEQTTEKDENGLDRQIWKPNDTLLSSDNVSADAQGVATASFTPSEAGQYRIAAEGRDSLGNTIRSATYVYVTTDDLGASIAWQQDNPFAITMVADKKEYKPGDTARILITSPFRQATGLLTVERGTILKSQVVDLQGNSPVIEIPITDDFLPNVYLSLSVIAPNAQDGNQPAFRQGWLGLNVSPKSRELQVQITPSSEKVAPGDTVSYTISARDVYGQPAQAEVSVALVDKAIYSLAAENTTPLMDQFYGHRGLSYAIASSMVALQSQIAVGSATPGAKGGGGGADAAGYIRRQFEDSAYWKADVTTDENGTAIVSVKLPDNLTTWRLTALAVTKDTLVGQASNEIVASKPLLLRTVLPRFMLAGDRFTAGAIVHNYTANSLTVNVTLAVSGVKMLDEAQAAQTLTIAAGSEATANFDVEAGTGTAASFTYSAQATGEDKALADGVALSLPIEPFLVPEVVATSAEVPADSTQTEQIFLPHGVDTRFGELKVTVSPSLAAGTASSLKYVEDYEWASVEAIVSRFLPLLQLNQAYKAALQTTPYAANLDKIVKGGVQELTSAQQYDGGWSWWSTGPSDPWMTAYALEGLTTARAAGYAVTDYSLNQASDYLNTWLNGGGASSGKGPAQPINDTAGRLNTRAYVIYALSLNGKVDVSEARALATRANSLAVYGQAYLALAFDHLGESGDAMSLLKNMIALVKQTSTTAHWEESSAARNAEYFLNMTTDTRTTALVLRVLLQHLKDDPLVEDSVRWLMTARREGHWVSTQETATVLGALAQYLSTSGELGANYSWTAQLNNSTLGAGSFSPGSAQGVELTKAVADLLINENNTLTLMRQGSGGKMYYDLSLSYYLPGEGLQARNEGLTVVREYVQPSSGKASEVPTRINSVKPGDLVEVRLTVIVPTDAYYLVVEDPLPAGLEAVNGTLNTTGLTANPNQQPGVDQYGNPTWFFFNNVEMRDDKTALFANYLAPGVYEYRYLARATTPGTFAALPARAYLAYTPDVWGRSDGATLLVTDK